MDTDEVDQVQIHAVARVCAMMTLWSVAEYVLGVLTAGAKAVQFLMFETQTSVSLPQREKGRAGRPSKADVAETMKKPLLQVLKARYGTLFSDKVLTLALDKVYEMYLLGDHQWRTMWIDHRPGSIARGAARGIGQLVLYRLWVVGLTTNWSQPDGRWMIGSRGPSASGTRTSPFAVKEYPLGDPVVSSKSAVAKAVAKLTNGMYKIDNAPQVQCGPTPGELQTITDGEATASVAATEFAEFASMMIVETDSEETDSEADSEYDNGKKCNDSDADKEDRDDDDFLLDDDSRPMTVEEQALSVNIKRLLQERSTRFGQRFLAKNTNSNFTQREPEAKRQRLEHKIRALSQSEFMIFFTLRTTEQGFDETVVTRCTARSNMYHGALILKGLDIQTLVRVII